MDKPKCSKFLEHRLSDPVHCRPGGNPQQPDNPELGLALMIESLPPGDTRLADILIDSYGTDLYRFAWALLDKCSLPTHEAVGALVSRTIAEAIDSSYRFRDEICVRTWLFKILFHRWYIEKWHSPWHFNQAIKRDARKEPESSNTTIIKTPQPKSSVEQQIWQDINLIENTSRIVAILEYAFDFDEEAIARITGLTVDRVRYYLNYSRGIFYPDLRLPIAEVMQLQQDATRGDPYYQVYGDQEVNLTDILDAELHKDFKHRWFDLPLDQGLIPRLKQLAEENYKKIITNHLRARRLLLLSILCAFMAIIFGSGIYLREGPIEIASVAPLPTHQVEVFPVYYSADKSTQRRLSISMPPGAASHPEQKYPVLFVIRSWSENNFFYVFPDHYFNRLKDFAHQLGYAVVILTYRSDWINGGPWVALNDAACALKWVDLYGSYYGLDVTRVILFGHDYGATLASNLALVNQLDTYTYDCSIEPPGWLTILGVIAYGGGMGVDPEADSLTLPGIDFNDRPDPTYNTYTRRCDFGENISEVDLNMIGLVNIHPAHWSTAHILSKEQQCLAEPLPAYWVDSQDPPFLLMYGVSDHVSRADKGEAFARYLSESGVPAKYVLVEGASHYSFGAQDPAWQSPIREFLAAVDP